MIKLGNKQTCPSCRRTFPNPIRGVRVPPGEVPSEVLLKVQCPECANQFEVDAKDQTEETRLRR